MLCASSISHSPTTLWTQGTNAHVVLACTHTTTRADTTAVAHSTTPHQTRRLWVLPPALLAARMASVASDALIHIHSAPLNHPRLAFLNDHIVLGQPLLPATAMCNALLSALCVVVSDSPVALAGVRFLQPLVLEEKGGACTNSAGARLHVTLHPHSGALELRSGGTGIATAHACRIDVARTLSTKAAPTQLTLIVQEPLSSCGMHGRAAVATVAAPHVSRDGFVVKPDAADAMLQLGVVPHGAPIKIPVAMAGVRGSYDAPTAEHTSAAMTAVCSGDGTMLRLGRAVAVHGLQTTTHARAPTKPERLLMYDTQLVTAHAADPEAPVQPRMHLHAATPVDGALAALAAVQQHEAVVVGLSMVAGAHIKAAVEGVLCVARSEHMLHDQEAPARHAVLQPSSLRLSMAPSRLEAAAGSSSFDGLRAVPVHTLQPGPGQLVVQVEVREGSIIIIQ